MHRSSENSCIRTQHLDSAESFVIDLFLFWIPCKARHPFESQSLNGLSRWVSDWWFQALRVASWCFLTWMAGQAFSNDGNFLAHQMKLDSVSACGRVFMLNNKQEKWTESWSLNELFCSLATVELQIACKHPCNVFTTCQKQKELQSLFLHRDITMNTFDSFIPSFNKETSPKSPAWACLWWHWPRSQKLSSNEGGMYSG